jgi:hypothetical protein
VGSTPLPGRTRQRRPDRLDQAAVGIGDDQLDSGQATGDQTPQERQPAGAVLGRGDLHPEDLPAPIGVHPGRDQDMDVDGSTCRSPCTHGHGN